MRRIIGPWLALAVILGACADAPRPLNSEYIEARFGNYGIEVLGHDAGADSAAIRRASLFSTHDGVRICRTYAVTRFDPDASSLVADEHARVLAGGSIGATFKANGWQVSKQTHYIGEIASAAAGPAVRSLMQLGGDRNLAMHVYRMWLKKGSQSIEYATIIEVHHPDYLALAALMKRYPGRSDSTPDARQIRAWRTLVAGGPE